MACDFATASLREYVAALYCKDIDGFWYSSAALSEFTALDNGGQAFNMALTYGTAIDVNANNDVVLEVACAISVGLQVPSDRVTDELGGFCGSPSPLVGSAAVEEEAATEDAAAEGDATEEAAAEGDATEEATEDAAERLLQEEAAEGDATEEAAEGDATEEAAEEEAAEPVQTEWVINMYVQSDPYATTYAVDDIIAVADTLTDEIDAVTSADFGAATVVSAAVLEVACAFVQAPAATPDKLNFVVAGTTDVSGYVYCYGEIEGTPVPAPVDEAAAERLLQEEAAEGDATEEAAEGDATEEAAEGDATEEAPEEAAEEEAAEEAPMTEEEFLAAHTMVRQMTVSPDFGFSMEFAAAEDHTYNWGCFCTSLNPGNPQFTTEVTVGVVQTLVTPVEPVSAQSVWCGVIMALFAAVFMY
jgi:hypothetical protein